jgi:6-pyruvoyltetrahydropterin 2'-reductase
LELALDNGFNVFFETNGTVNIDFEEFVLYKKVNFAVSVKLSNSGEPYAKRVNKEAIRNIALCAKEAFFKFVLDKKMIEQSAKKEILDITSGFDIPTFCMPLGKNRVEIKKNALLTALFCIKNGYNYSDRVHINLWNNRKGV